MFVREVRKGAGRLVEGDHVVHDRLQQVAKRFLDARRQRRAAAFDHDVVHVEGKRRQQAQRLLEDLLHRPEHSHLREIVALLRRQGAVEPPAIIFENLVGARVHPSGETRQTRLVHRHIVEEDVAGGRLFRLEHGQDALDASRGVQSAFQITGVARRGFRAAEKELLIPQRLAQQRIRDVVRTVAALLRAVGRAAR